MNACDSSSIPGSGREPGQPQSMLRKAVSWWLGWMHGMQKASQAQKWCRFAMSHSKGGCQQVDAGDALPIPSSKVDRVSHRACCGRLPASHSLSCAFGTHSHPRLKLGTRSATGHAKEDCQAMAGMYAGHTLRILGPGRERVGHGACRGGLPGGTGLYLWEAVSFPSSGWERVQDRTHCASWVKVGSGSATRHAEGGCQEGLQGTLQAPQVCLECHLQLHPLLQLLQLLIHLR